LQSSHGRGIISGMNVVSFISKILPTQTAYAHCDLPCGVYDPAQARIEAESVLKIMEKYEGLEAEEQKWRAVFIKEQRAELVKHHLWVLWTDYFKPEHVEKFPQLHELFWHATKQAGQTKKSVDPAEGQKLLDLIDEIADIFKQTKAAK
jgi:nickel superoxide dismutase